MKSLRKLVFVLVVVLGLVAVQSAFAAEIEVTGIIDRIGVKSIDVISGDSVYTFYDIPFLDLQAAEIILAVGDEVTVNAYVVAFPNGMSKNIAYSLTKGGVTYTWHPNAPKAGSQSVTELSAIDAGGQSCICKCVENTECYECNCYCGDKVK